MDSYQNLALLENLYRLKALGYSYVDPVTPNRSSGSETLPSSLEALAQSIRNCHLCDLSKSRRQSMPGYGSVDAKVMFVDSHVSLAEDESNDYYVGRSGAMLRDMIEKVLGLSIGEVYLTHAVKCKPFGLQIPSQSEYNSCSPFLIRQFESVSPRVIVTLGPDAYRFVCGEESDFERMRGHAIPFGSSVVVPMYHPNFLLRNPSLKKEALRDLQLIREKIG